MEPEIHNDHSFITWLVTIGILLVIIVSVSTYVIANPDGLSGLFGGKKHLATPIVELNGSPNPVIARLPHTKHYSNIFFEFDYPEIFSITSEHVNTAHTVNEGGKDQFGVAEVVLQATGTDGVYTIRVTSEANYSHIDYFQAEKSAKELFSSRPEKGPNDSFQNVTVGSQPAYKELSSDTIRLILPTENLNYFAEIHWPVSTGVRGIASGFLGIIEDTLITK